jgi:hypothetical protein
MTITKVSQVVGIRLNFASVGSIFNLDLSKRKRKMKKQHGKKYLDYFFELLKDLQTQYKENFIDEKYELKLYELTHDIYKLELKNDKKSEKLLELTNDRFVVGIELVDTSLEESYEDEKNYIVPLKKITDAFEKMKKWQDEKGVAGDISMYTIHDDCSCCS